MLFLATSFGWQTSAQNGGDTCAEAVAVTPGIYSDAAITIQVLVVQHKLAEQTQCGIVMLQKEMVQ